MTRGPAAIGDAFATARAEGRPALIPYVMTGYPTAAEALAIARELVAGGADLLEVGMPFSDPLADGPTIQAAGTRALANGTTVPTALELVRDLRDAGVTIPLVLMGYVNPVLAYGVERFCADAAAAGADGLIVADLPFEEGEQLRTACGDAGMSLVPLVAPTTPDDRIREVAGAADGFVYCVSLTGVTGARIGVGDEVNAFLDRARAAAAPLPTAVGFGISTPEHVTRIAPHADGAVFASALIDHLDSLDSSKRPDAARQFVAAMRA